MKKVLIHILALTAIVMYFVLQRDEDVTNVYTPEPLEVYRSRIDSLQKLINQLAIPPLTNIDSLHAPNLDHINSMGADSALQHFATWTKYYSKWGHRGDSTDREY